MIEPSLKTHMRACADAYAAAREIKLSTVAEQAAGDWRFFDRMESDTTFTARKYDSVMAFFSRNWPADLPWPADVPRPAKPDALAE